MLTCKYFTFLKKVSCESRRTFEGFHNCTSVNFQILRKLLVSLVGYLKVSGHDESHCRNVGTGLPGEDHVMMMIMINQYHDH